MAAARAFMEVRPEAMPVAVVAYNPEQHVLTEFTTDSTVLNQAVATDPEIVYGTEIYDSLIFASEMATDQGLKRATAVLLSDGNEVSSESGRGRHAGGARSGQHARHLGRVQVDPLQPRAAERPRRRKREGGSSRRRRRRSSSRPSSRSGSGSRASTSLTYRSLLPPNTKANVRATVDGLPAATATYTTPEHRRRAARHVRAELSPTRSSSLRT